MNHHEECIESDSCAEQELDWDAQVTITVTRRDLAIIEDALNLWSHASEVFSIETGPYRVAQIQELKWSLPDAWVGKIPR